jgi:hemerythrin-like metal-binding protein
MGVSPTNRDISEEARQSIVEEHRLLAEKIDQACLHIDAFFSAPAKQSPLEFARIVSLLDELIETAHAHFQHEEDLMTKNEFPGLIFHKRDHDYLLRSLMDFTSSLSHETVPVSTDIGVNLRSWLTYHIKKFDEAYVAFAGSRKPDASG